MALEDRHYSKPVSGADGDVDTLPAAFQEPKDEVLATLEGTSDGDDELQATADAVIRESFQREADRLYLELDMVQEQFADRAELYDEMMQELDREIRATEQETGAATYDGAAEAAKDRLHELRRERRQVRREFLNKTVALQDRAVDIVQELDRVDEDERVADRFDDLL